MAVHHVHVNDARPRIHHQLDLLAEASEVSGEDRGRYANVLQKRVRHAAARYTCARRRALVS